MNVVQRIIDEERAWERLRNRANLAALLAPSVAKPIHLLIDKAAEVRGELEGAVHSALNPPQAGRHLGPKEAIESLARALTSIARERRALRVPSDSIRDLVLAEVSEDERPFWRIGAGYIVGLINSDAQMRAFLKSEGVLSWTNSIDRDIRLVDARWCTSAETIHAHVTDTTITGRKCRFCLCDENPEVQELQPVDPDQRTGYDKTGDVYLLKPGVVYTHAPCQSFWEQWVEIAEQYARRKAGGK